MLRETMRGAAAGALGTAVLNTATYADMAVRGRPASKTPDEAAKRLAKKAHVPLRHEGEKAQKQDNRAQGIGALLGYAAGVGVGAAYGALRARVDSRRPPDERHTNLLLAGVALAGAAMVAGDTPTVALGVSDPRDWDKRAWTMHAVPHFLYGVATAAAYEAMRDGH